MLLGTLFITTVLHRPVLVLKISSHPTTTLHKRAAIAPTPILKRHQTAEPITVDRIPGCIIDRVIIASAPCVNNHSKHIGFSQGRRITNVWAIENWPPR